MQEAETALVALGARLNWKHKIPASVPDDNFVWEDARLNTEHGHQNYSIHFDRDRSPQTSAEVTYWRSKGRHDKRRQEASNIYNDGGGKRWYNSVAEARAACEIHAATGQFPLSVEPEVLRVVPAP